MNNSINPRNFIFAIVILICLVVILSFNQHRFDIQIDEVVYQKDIALWNAQGMDGLKQANDNKPISFLYIEKVLGADINNTRLLNIILILACTYLIFRTTHRYESFLFILFPLVLNSMWLTVEIFEIFFILLTLNTRYSGAGIGLATIFRPYAALYSILNTKRLKGFIIVVGVFCAILIYLGIFSWYWLRLFNYGATDEFNYFENIDIIAIFIWMLMMYCGWSNKTMRNYGLIGSVSILIRPFAHYFLPSIAWFFVGYLKEDKK